MVESLEEEAHRGHSNDAVVYFFTNNSTVEEATLFNGSSSSPKLLKLVIQVKTLEMLYNIQLLVSHVSGNQMCAQGGDGVS